MILDANGREIVSESQRRMRQIMAECVQFHKPQRRLEGTWAMVLDSKGEWIFPEVAPISERDFRLPFKEVK